MKTLKINWLGMASIAACALCCTLPLIESVVGLTALVFLGVRLEKAAILLVGLAFVTFLIPQLKTFTAKRKDRAAYIGECRTTCATDCSCNAITNTLPEETTMLQS